MRLDSAEVFGYVVLTSVVVFAMTPYFWGLIRYLGQ